MATPKNVVVGSHVWIEDKESAWIDGEVIQVDGVNVHVRPTKGKPVVVDISKVYPKDNEAPPGGIDDMTKMSYLNEPSVLNNLAVRYKLNDIYTYTGNILIAINPFQRLLQLVSQETMEKYKGADLGDLSPHAFAIADVAYRQMINEGKNNSILVSGESGAGKTETTKLIMSYLAFLGGRSGSGERTVEQQVLDSNPVLEAFGNAKTVRNNNSSRFGKFVEIQFNKNGKISGAAIRTYLLERSRVCQISTPERNYHSFYFLCAAPSEVIEKYKLADPGSYHYLNQSNCIKVDGINDAEEYLATIKAMDTVGISKEEQEAIFRVVAAVLHLGNVSFAKGKEADSSVIKDGKSEFHLKTVSELLMCDRQKLENALIKKVIVTPEGSISTTINPASAVVSRDGLAKLIYSWLFHWLVDKINLSIGEDKESDQKIGVLDIYGFESFQTNSFEQLCINFTNEKLQQHFNQNIFKMEQEEYTREEIDWSYIEFVDNQDVLDLIEKKPGGIIALLDEECMFPKSTHETFANKLYTTIKSPRFIKPKLSRTAFTISHYAGEVTYQADHFLDKNKDYVVAEHQELLSASMCPFVSGLLRLDSKSTKSIGSDFKAQLHDLMVALNKTEPHYIRCVKPNELKKPGIFDNINVLQQLRCGGVLEAIRISSAGYPTRKIFHDFLHRFRILRPDVVKGIIDEKVACQKILDDLGLKGYQIGKTKVFLKAGEMAELDAMRTEVRNGAARNVQSQFRTHVTREKFVELREAAICLQSFCRATLAYKHYQFLRKQAAAIKFQAHIRHYVAWIKHLKTRKAAIELQTVIRTMRSREEFMFKKQNKAATIIQRYWRGHKAYVNYNCLKKAAVSYQCCWRQKVSRKQLRELRVAARDTRALKDTNKKLEERIEDLKRRLEQEKQMRSDLENNKAIELANLQGKLRDAEKRAEEAASMKEREEARKVMEEALSQEREKIDRLFKEVKELKAHNEELQKNLNQQKDFIHSLKETLNTKEALLLQEQDKKVAIKKELVEAQEQNSNLLRKLEDADANVHQLQEKIQRMEENITAEKEKVVISARELAEARVSIEDHINRLEYVTKEKDNLRETFQSLEETLSMKEALLLQERSEKDAIKEELVEAQGRNSDLVRKLEDSDANISQLGEKIQRLEENMTVEKQQIMTSASELAKAQETIEDYLTKLEDVTKEKENLQVTLQRQKETLDMKEDLLLQVQNEKDIIVKECAEATDRNTNLLRKLEDADANMCRLKEEKQSLEGNITALETKLQDARQTNEQLRIEAEEKERRIYQLQFDIERLKETAASKEAMLLREREQTDTAIRGQAEAHEKHTEILNKFEYVHTKIDLLQDSIQRLEQSTSSKENLLLSEREEKEAIKKALDEAQEKNQELLHKLEDVEGRFVKLQYNIHKLEEEVAGRDCLLLSERQQKEAISKSLDEARTQNDELLQKCRDYDQRVVQLQDHIYKLEFDDRSRMTVYLAREHEAKEAEKALAEVKEKYQRLQKEFEDRATFKIPQNNIQRHEETAPKVKPDNEARNSQILTTPPSANSYNSTLPSASSYKINRTHRTTENGHVANGVHRHSVGTQSASIPESKPEVGAGDKSELTNKKVMGKVESPQKSITEKHQEEQHLLIASLEKDLGFSASKPVAALFIYKCLLRWRSFEAAKTDAFDIIVRKIEAEIQDRNDIQSLAYWLSNLLALSVILRRTVKLRVANAVPDSRRSSSTNSPMKSSQWTQMSSTNAGPDQLVGGMNNLPQFEAKHASLQFKQKITSIIENIYVMISDSLKNELAALIPYCIQDSRTSQVLESRLSHWKKITDILSKYLEFLHKNYVPSMMVRELFIQVFSSMDVQLFNCLIMRRECCLFSNAKHISSGLSELNHWCAMAQEYAGSSWDALKHIRQAIEFLILDDKPRCSLSRIQQLCPDLNAQQLHWVVTLYSDDSGGKNVLSASVISSIKDNSRSKPDAQKMLEDVSSLPEEDLTMGLPDFDLSDVDWRSVIRRNPTFMFLSQGS